jgi:glycosyltransferase involved in cell wall biosynthesis
MKITILIPVFNEKNYILKVLEKVNLQKKKYNLEIIVIDDCSTDGTVELLKNHSHLYDQIFYKDINEGKGSAIIKGIEFATGEYTLVQDADLEYSPNDYNQLFKPIDNNADAVYGSRFKGSEPKRIIYFFNRVANFLITFLVNCLTNINFSDVETGYKLVKTDLLKKINLQEKTFAIEVELTMKLSKLNIKFYEVGINYDGRKYEEGKKIQIKDGFIAIYKIFYYFIKK